MKEYKIDNRWSIHSYYTISPYAPDKSGRLLLSGADLETGIGEVYILGADGKVLDRFGKNRVFSPFYHTGFWQTWSHDAKTVFYQAGTPDKPKIAAYDTISGRNVEMPGDMEGAPPFDMPVLSGLMGMIYACGYADGKYHPENAPVPFGERDRHGIFENNVYKNTSELKLSINDIIRCAGMEEKFAALDRDVEKRLGKGELMTLMAYCVRWNRQGDRFLFYFGNHCTDRKRREENITMIFTGKRDFSELRLALDLSGKKSCHWSWHPDGRRIIGYAETDNKVCLCSVNCDGSDFHKISNNDTCGHPSICCADHNLLVTDNYEKTGKVQLIDLQTDSVIREFCVPRVFGDIEPRGRNPYRICNHPCFSEDGKKLIVNALPNSFARLWEFEL